MLSVVVAPFVGIWYLLRLSNDKSGWRVVGLWTSGCLGLLTYCAAALVFAICSGGEIGESGKNRLARAYGAPVVAALERYHRDHGGYPTNLGDLVPAYVAGSDLRAPEASVLKYPFEYRADSGSYRLLVRYVGPGMNECRYTPRTAWHCGGYF